LIRKTGGEKHMADEIKRIDVTEGPGPRMSRCVASQPETMTQ